MTTGKTAKNNKCRLGATTLVLVVWSFIFAECGHSQPLLDRQQRPFDARPLLPSFEPPATEGEDILPRIQYTPREESNILTGVFVTEYQITGNTVLPDQVLVELVQPYLNRRVSFAEFAALRDDLTRAYIARGYVNSGAVIPPQKGENGVVLVRIVEGGLSGIEYHTDGRLRESYVRRRLLRGIAYPLHVGQLEQRLQQLQQDDRIQHIQAALAPTETRGESLLRLQLIEEKPLRIALQADNFSPPSIGAETLRVNVSHTNISGYGDRLEASFDRSEGLWSARARYQVLLNAGDTSFDVHAAHSESDLIALPTGFESVGIESESSTYGFTLSHPLVNLAHRTFRVSLTGEARRSESFIETDGGSFSIQGEPDKVTVMRVGLDWSHRSRRQVLAARSLITLGIDVLDATVEADDSADSQFAALLLQGQWARRLKLWDAEVFARGDIQLSESRLLGMEQFAVGGHATVRGYRENTLVHDQGWVVSVEGRVPVWRRRAARLEMGLFADAGRGWDKHRELSVNGRTDAPGSTLSSAGITLRYSMNSRLNLQMDWAKRLEGVPKAADDYLQDRGIHVRLSTVF